MRKEGTLEALDFVVKILVQHEKNLDRLIAELGETLKRFGEAENLTGKIQGIEDSLSAIQKEIYGLVGSSPSPQEIPVKSYRPRVIARCEKWEDFRGLATGAEIVSFLLKEAEEAFQINALKEDLTLTYSGNLPKRNLQDENSLRIWLSRELNVTEENIFEGTFLLSGGFTRETGKH